MRKKKPPRQPSPGGDEIRQIRESLDMSQEDFVRALDGIVSYRNYQRYESGHVQKVPAEILDRARQLKKR